MQFYPPIQRTFGGAAPTAAAAAAAATAAAAAVAAPSVAVLERMPAATRAVPVRLRAAAFADGPTARSDPSLSPWFEAEAADAGLLRAVLCVASATLVLALVSSML